MSEDLDIKENESNEESLQSEESLQMDRAKKNLVYLGMFSVFMLFAGFTSAYIVTMGDNFWIKAALPQAFWISTAIIAMSSVTIQLALMYNKKENTKMLKTMVVSTFVLGCAFVYFQIQGYGQLADNGLHPTGSGVVVSDGRYEDYYTIKMDNEHILVNGNQYLKGKTPLTASEMKRLQEFMGQFMKLTPSQKITLNAASKDFVLYYRDSEMRNLNSELRMNDSSAVNVLDRERLTALSRHILDGRGDFFVRGEMGKDFHIYYKGQEIQYKDRKLYFKGRPLDTRLQIKIMQSADLSSSFLWIITVAHLLHILITLIYISRVVIRSFTGVINSTNAIGLKTGALFWHFLGLLWLYLLLFLLFIH